MKNMMYLFMLAIFHIGAIQAETIFHLAMPVSTLEGVQEFYEDLGGKRLDEREGSMAFDLYGHSVVFRLYEDFQLPEAPLEPAKINGHLIMIPARHFGVIISREVFEKIEKTMLEKSRPFFAEPVLIRPGEFDEMRFMMIQDPNGYAVEIKSHISDPYLPVVK